MTGPSGPSLRRRLVAVTVGSSGVGLFLACSAFLALDISSDHRQAELALHTLAGIFSYASAGTLTFEDRSGAGEVLAAMRGEPGIVRAALYERSGALFASYVADAGKGAAVWPSPPADGSESSAGVIRVSRPVEVDGERIGTLVVEGSLASLQVRLMLKAFLVAAGMIASCLLVFGLGSRLVGGVIAPILELARLAREITATQDYARRATVPESEEVGVLAITLNAMLDRIERDMDLRAQREQLEKINIALEHEKDRALVAARTKSEFLANMSHEIRTPMTAILGYIDLIRIEPPAPGELDGMLEIVQRNSKHLLSVINDILDLSKLEAGRVQIESVWCSPYEIAEDARELVAERAAAKGLALEIELRGRIPLGIRTDPTRLRQILLNLLSNAIKFTEKGSVHLTIWLRGTHAPQGQATLMFEVADTGIGIPEDKHRSVFEAFTQADTSTTRRFGGTGLGLSISARLAGLLGGTLELSSSLPGVGTTFILALPAGEVAELDLGVVPRVPESSALPAAEVSALSGRVLVAEDSVDTQRLVRMLLRRVGLEVDIAENGERACEMARAAREAGAPYNLILMDMQMPVMDGYAAVRKLRGEDFSEPIIAFTAHAMSGERERCIAAGCDDYASKPIDRSALLQLVRRLLKAT